MALFIYDLEQAADMQAELRKARASKDLRVHGVAWKEFRRTLTMLAYCRVVVVPDGLQHHTNIIERLKEIARLTPGTETRPLCVHQERYRRETTKQPSAVAAAAPPVQQRAAADGLLSANA